jgi:hypothetical protein
MEADHFIMLDAINAISGNEFDRSYPKVQIVYPSIMNSCLDNKANESNPENGLTHKKKRKYLFTITLNLDADY